MRHDCEASKGIMPTPRGWKRQHGNTKTLYVSIILSYLRMTVFF